MGKEDNLNIKKISAFPELTKNETLVTKKQD